MKPARQNAMPRVLHVVEEGDGWGVVESDQSEAAHRFETKAQALSEARRISIQRGVEVVVHGPDGSILERDMFVR